jgi:hypothetical protein
MELLAPRHSAWGMEHRVSKRGGDAGTRGHGDTATRGKTFTQYLIYLSASPCLRVIASPRRPAVPSA